MTGPFLGKFRGVVSDINDPLMLGRIRATVPDVAGADPVGWAAPCAPFGGSQAGFFALPVVGSGVWIEFEQGDPSRPIWVGSWWGSSSEVPSALLAPPYRKVMVVTPGGHTVTLDDTPGAGGITLETADGAKLVLSATEVVLDNGQGASIKLSGPQVSINGGALEVI